MRCRLFSIRNLLESTKGYMGPCGYPRVKDPWNNLKLFHILPHMDIINYSICVLHFGIINNQIPRVYLRYTKIPNISMRDLHDPELYTIEIINIKQSTTKPTTYKQYQPYVSMIWIGHHQGTNQPYINPQKYNRKILSGIVQLPPLVRGAQEWETLAIDISIKQNSLSRKIRKIAENWSCYSWSFSTIIHYHVQHGQIIPQCFMMVFERILSYFIIFYGFLWPIADGWGVFDLKRWNCSRGLSPPFMGQNNFPTKQDNNL